MKRILLGIISLATLTACNDEEMASAVKNIDMRMESFDVKAQMVSPAVVNELMKEPVNSLIIDNISFTTGEGIVNAKVSYELTEDEYQLIGKFLRRFVEKTDTVDLKQITLLAQRVKELGTYEVNIESPYELVTNSRGNCEAFAYIMRRVLNELNVENKYVFGFLNNETHVWNKVKLGNDWIYIDATPVNFDLKNALVSKELPNNYVLKAGN